MKIAGLVSVVSLVGIMVSGCVADGTEQPQDESFSQESQGENVATAEAAQTHDSAALEDWRGIVSAMEASSENATQSIAAEDPSPSACSSPGSWLCCYGACIVTTGNGGYCFNICNEFLRQGCPGTACQ
jgi:hypothetical protein